MFYSKKSVFLFSSLIVPLYADYAESLDRAVEIKSSRNLGCLENLSDDIIIHGIFEYLDTPMLLKFSQTSKAAFGLVSKAPKSFAWFFNKQKAEGLNIYLQRAIENNAPIKLRLVQESDRKFYSNFSYIRIPPTLAFLEKTLPYCSSVVSLTISGFIGSEGTKLLANSNTLSNLRHLDLGFNRIDGSDMIKLSQAQHFSNLTSLNLQFNSIYDSGLDLLMKSPVFNNIQFLNINRNYISDDQVSKFENEDVLPKLQWLEVSASEITSKTVQDIREARPNLDVVHWGAIR